MCHYCLFVCTIVWHPFLHCDHFFFVIDDLFLVNGTGSTMHAHYTIT